MSEVMQEEEAERPEKDVLARKGYYDQMTNTFQEMAAKRDVLQKEILELLEEKMGIDDKHKDLNDRLAEAIARQREAAREKRKTERILRQLEAGGATARAALRKLQLSKMDIKERVAGMREEFRSRSSPEVPAKVKQALTITDHAMPRPGGRKIRMRSYIPQKQEPKARQSRRTRSQSPPPPTQSPSKEAQSSERIPAILYFRGEGHVCGDFQTHEWLCANLAHLSGVPVVAVDTRQAPEARFPAAFEDAYAALHWVARGGLGWQPFSVAVAGDASGGGLAVSVSLKARDDEQAPHIALQILFYPWLDLRPISESILSCDEADEGQLMQQEALEFYAEMIAPPLEAAEIAAEEEAAEAAEAAGEEPDIGPDVREWTKDVRASPLLAESWEDVPRTFIAWADDDLLALDAEQCADRLKEEVNEDAVHEMMMEGPLGHGFAKLGNLSEAYACIASAAAFASGAMRAKFAEVDADGDGVLTEDEIREGLFKTPEAPDWTGY